MPEPADPFWLAVHFSKFTRILDAEPDHGVYHEAAWTVTGPYVPAEQLAGAVGDLEGIRAVVEQIAAEVRALGHDDLALRLDRLRSPLRGQSDVTPREVTARADVARVEHLQQQMGDEDHG